MLEPQPDQFPVKTKPKPDLNPTPFCGLPKIAGRSVWKFLFAV